MGMFGSKKVVANTKEAEEEKAVNKARLLATQGENKGEELKDNQARSIRKVF